MSNKVREIWDRSERSEIDTDNIIQLSPSKHDVTIYKVASRLTLFQEVKGRNIKYFFAKSLNSASKATSKIVVPTFPAGFDAIFDFPRFQENFIPSIRIKAVFFTESGSVIDDEFTLRDSFVWKQLGTTYRLIYRFKGHNSVRTQFGTQNTALFANFQLVLFNTNVWGTNQQSKGE